MTRVSPAELFLGMKIRTRLDIMKPKLCDTMMKKVSHVVDKTKSVQMGDRVLVRDYRGSEKSWVQGVITAKISPVTYNVEVEDRIWKRHLDQILDLSGLGSNPFQGDDGVQSKQLVTDALVVTQGVDHDSSSKLEDSQPKLPPGITEAKEGTSSAPQGTSNVTKRDANPTVFSPRPCRVRKSVERLIETM